MLSALPRRLVALAAAVSLGLAPVGPLWGQEVDPSGDPLPITLQAKPDGGWVGTPILLFGQTVGTDSLNSVTLSVTLPGEGPGALPQVSTVKVDDQGLYSLLFEDTSQPGRYSVLATAPDGRGQVSHEFTILEAAGVAEEAGESLRDAVAVTLDMAEVVQAKLQDLPPSPAKEEAVAEVAALIGKIRTLQQAMPETETAVQTLIIFSGSDEDVIEAMRGPQEQFFQGVREAKSFVRQSAAELDRLRSQIATCDSLEVVIEGLKWASFLMNFAVGKVLDLAINFGKELLGVVADRVAKAVGAHDLLSFGASEVAKNVDLIVKGKVETDSLVGLINDTLGKAAEQWMSVYCEVFTGPITGEMSAEFYSGGQMWWSYKMSLSGRIVVHYPKDAAGDSIPLSGHIEGYGHSFSLWENALTVLYPKLMSSAVQRKEVIGPVDLGPAVVGELTNYAEGSVVGAGLPNSFFIAVTGTAEKDRVVINLGPARTDMEPKARVVAIILSPLTLLPVVTAYELPYKDARFVFERASQGAPMTVPLATQGKVMRGKQEFYSERGNAEAHGTYRVTLELCNPAC